MTGSGPTHAAAEVQRVFAANLELFETVELAGLPFGDREEADRMCRELAAGEVELPVEIPDNAEILDEPAETGYFGVVSRADLPPELAEAVFREGASGVVGPVAYDRRFWVLRILMSKRALLTRAVYDYCVSLLEGSGGT